MVNLVSSIAKSKQLSDSYTVFLNGLKNLYKTKLLPLEETYSFHYFHSPPLDDGDFDAKPMILLVGQYSTGKTTLIKHLLKTNFPGMRIGPEPTTDKFISVMYGNSERIIPGNALVVDPKKQFRGLSKFGNSFLNKLQCSQINCDVLKNLSIVDTPGILSGEKQRVNRGYDFVGVLKWFAERADRVMLFFDAHKLDISDEFRRCIEALQGHDEKIQIILNKSDMVDQQQLMRVYGALMWSLGKIINTPEVVRVYIGSFWDQPIHYCSLKKLFEVEQQDLLEDLLNLPKNSVVRKLNDFIKRIRSAKVHAYIMDCLHSNMPVFFGREKKKQELIASLNEIFVHIKNTYDLSEGDLPDCSKMQEKLKLFDFSNLVGLNKRMIRRVDEMMESDVSKLMMLMNGEVVDSERIVSGGMFDIINNKKGPFSYQQSEGINAGIGEKEWIVDKQREKYDAVFSLLKLDDGKIPARIAKSEMNKSNLPSTVLAQIWKLSDVDNDGCLDGDEFALAMYLIDIKLNGYDLPQDLPEHLIPPAKRAPCA